MNQNNSSPPNEASEIDLSVIEERSATLSISQSDISPEIKISLFEKFLVIGCEKEDMIEFDNNLNCTEVLLPGKVLYAYPPLLEAGEE